MKKKLYLFVTLIIITIILITIGYSAFTNSLSITNSVAHIRADKLLRVTNVTTNSSYVSNLDYGVSSITSDIALPAGASITYTVTVKNLWNVPVALSGVTFKNGNNTISSLSSDISPSNYVKICNQNECTTNVSKTFDITITNNGSSSLNLSLTSVLTFTEFYQINYNDGIGVNSLGEALDGTNYQYTFNNNIPTNVILEGNYTSYTYQNGTLNIQNVTGNVTVYKAYNINYDNGILGTVKPGTNYEYEFTNLPPSHIILEGTCTSHTYNNNTINIVNVGSDITIYKAYTITYNDNLQGLVKANGNYTYTFTSDIPSSITINNGTYGSYTYTNNVLSIINVTGNLIVTGSTQNEPDGTKN